MLDLFIYQFSEFSTGNPKFFISYALGFKHICRFNPLLNFSIFGSENLFKFDSEYFLSLLYYSLKSSYFTI